MFGKRIQTLRTEKRLSQKDLSNLMHISQSSIAGYELENNAPDYDKLLWLCNYFNVSADYLLGFSDIRLPYAQTFNSALTEDEKVSLKYYRRLSSESRDIIKGKMVELYREENAKGKKQNRKQTG